jgi:drug/metabolite transporter (DMT)-like permease
MLASAPALIGTSFLMFVGGNGLITIAEKTVHSGVASVLAATTPLWLGLFAMFWKDGERLTGRGWLGLLVGLIGVLVLLSNKFYDPNHPGLDWFGAVCVLGSAGSWALGSLMLRRVRHRGDHLTSAAYQLLMGGIIMVSFGLTLGERYPKVLTAGAIGAFVYLLVVGSLLGFVAFNYLMGHVSANKVGTYAYVNPAVAMLVAWGAGEPITWLTLAGIGVILVGVFLVRAGEAPAHQACQVQHNQAKP